MINEMGITDSRLMTWTLQFRGEACGWLTEKKNPPVV